MGRKAAPVVQALFAAVTISAAGAQPISEAEFLSRLTDEHPAVVALRGGLAAAEGDRRMPRTENLDLNFEREAPEDAPSQSTVTLRWRPPLDGRRGLANEAATTAVTAAEHRLEWNRFRLRAELRELFAQWSFAVDRRDLLADVSDRVARLAARSRARASSGEESGLDARRLELAAASTSSALAGAEVGLIGVIAEIRAVFPEMDTTRRPVRPELPHVTAPLDIRSRADIAALEFEAERAELSRRLAGRFVEFPALVAGWTFIEEEDGDVDGPVFGLEWSIPLFDRRQGERARVRGEAEVARARAEMRRARAASELEASAASYARLRGAAIDVLETTSGGGSIIEAATAEFRAEEATLTDLLDAIRSVADTRIRALELHREALAAHRRFEMSAGRPLTDGESR